MRALAWALIHSLWQCLAVAALAAVLMAFSRRPPLRYMIAVGALAVMLAAPAASFLVLLKPAAPVQASVPATQSPLVFAPQIAPPAAVPFVAVPIDGAIRALENSPRLSQNLLSWLVAAWLCGVAGFSLRFAGGFLLLEHKRRSQSFAPSPPILVLCRQLQDQLGLSRAIQYLECTWLQAPAVIGWLRPIVLLPACALTGLSEAQLRAVIAHELAHIRRFDAFVNLFQILTETLLFYHPAAWWLNQRIRAERELCCDEIALSVAGDRLDYAQALTLMAEWESAPALAMAANRGPLTERIFHILGRTPYGATQRMIGLTGSILFLTAALAAANALFGAGSPIPMAQAKESVTRSVSAALSSGQSAVDHAVQALQAAAKNPEPDKPSQKTAAQSEAAKQPEKLAPLADLSELLPKETLPAPAVVASLDARTANGQPAALVAPATLQASLNSPAKVPPILYHCRNSSVFGQVISAKAIQMQGFACVYGGNPVGGEALYGACPHASTYPERANHRCKFDVTLNVQLADPGDAAKMQTGKIVRLAGAFRVGRENRIDYVSVANAKVIWTDPFDRRAAAAASKDNNPPAASVPPVLASSNAAPPPPVQALLNTPPMDPVVIQPCRNTSVFGRVVSPKTIEMQGFTCFLDTNPGNTSAIAAQDIPFGSCPLASTTTAHKYKCKFDVNLNVRLTSPSDAAKMVPGKLVRLGGNFRVWKENKLDYLTVSDAKVLFTDFYWSDGRGGGWPGDSGPYYSGGGGLGGATTAHGDGPNGPMP